MFPHHQYTFFLSGFGKDKLEDRHNSKSFLWVLARKLNLEELELRIKKEAAFYFYFLYAIFNSFMT